MGCSAGGHLSACLSTFKEDWSVADDNIDTFPFRPDFTILISPVITMHEEFVHKGSRQNLLGDNSSAELTDLFSCELQVDKNTPPAFIIHASDDNSVSSINSILYYSALKKNNVKMSTLHIFPEGGHSIALRNNPGTTNTWTYLVEKWLYETDIID